MKYLNIVYYVIFNSSENIQYSIAYSSMFCALSKVVRRQLQFSYSDKTPRTYETILMNELERFIISMHDLR